ncbi:MAG: transposase [Myxococcales bacterium]|nr:transposase [Myxococcales bacterium]
MAQIQAVFDEHQARYGAPRICRALRERWWQIVSRHLLLQPRGWLHTLASLTLNSYDHETSEKSTTDAGGVGRGGEKVNERELSPHVNPLPTAL